MQNRPVAVVILGQGGQRLDPVARIEVEDVAHHALVGLVDVAADDALRVMAPGFRRQQFLEAADIIDRVLHLKLRPGGQRPVGQPQPPAHYVQVCVQRQRGFVGPVTEQGEPLGVAHHHVEHVAVDDEVALAVRRLVDGGLLHLDAAEMAAVIVAQEFVVVAGNIDQPASLAHLAQKLLHHVVVGLRPIPALLQPPPVDDVADKIDRVGIVVLQEVKQKLGLTALGAQMNVGQEHRPDANDVGFLAQVRQPSSNIR